MQYPINRDGGLDTHQNPKNSRVDVHPKKEDEKSSYDYFFYWN